MGVLGAGSWGTALAIVLAENGHNVDMWEFRDDVARKVARDRVNVELLPGVIIHEKILITSDL